MRSAFNKDILRSIKASWGRFIAILVIVALGAGFYAGLRMTAPDMRIAADDYYDGTHLYDIRVLSTMGLSEQLLDELAQVEGVEEVMGAYETDVLGVVDGSQVAIRVHSLDTAAAEASDTSDGVNALSDNSGYLNRPILASGTWPSKEGECVLSAETLSSVEFELGDTIKMTEGVTDVDEVLRTSTYTVVGFVRSPYYSSSASLGITSIGSGSIEQYMYVPQGDFKEDLPYSNAFLAVKGARELDATSQAYFDQVGIVVERIEQEEAALETLRLEEIKAEAQEELDAERSNYEDEKTSALTDLAVWEAELALAKEQIDQSEALLLSSLGATTSGQNGAGYVPTSTEQEADGSVLSPDNLAVLSPELAEAKASYEQSLAEYGTAKADAEKTFADAEAELDEAQQTIDESKAPELFIMDRSKNYGAKSFDSDAGRVDQIAHVFPLMFFLVAALISLTTMTRMVEEERTLIGTYKALGYSRQRIASKYVLYALIASIIGAVIGIATLTQLLPGVIMNAYKIMYDVPTLATPIDPGIAALSAALGIGATCFAAWAAAVTTLREKPASLMLPRSPKAGKRIFLERIRPVWTRLSFSWKVTCRNLFRYKKRLAMTLIGIAGCTALLLTGFGLSNAINDIIPKQFGEIYQYNTTIALTEDASAADRAKLEEVLDDESLVEASTYVHTENVTVTGQSEGNQVALLTAPEDVEGFNDFHLMRNRESQETLLLTDDSVILSEKLANSLGVEEGDTLSLAKQDAAGYATEDRYEFTVGGVMENYVSHYLVLSPTLYTEVIGEEPAFLTVLAEGSTDNADREYISDTLLALEGIKTVGYNDEVISSYEDALASVDSIVVVLIVAAMALAFVVLYNLTNINITERQREIATLKVLGFSKREMAQYVFREMILLTILGAALGLILGVFMEAFVVTTAEVDAVMFSRAIHPTSFVIAFVLTVLFSLMIAFFMRSKLANIDMVESLKSNE